MISIYDIFTLNEKSPSASGSDFWYTGMQMNSYGVWSHQYPNHSYPYNYDRSRDVIIVTGDSYERVFSQATSQFYSYPVEGGIYDDDSGLRPQINHTLVLRLRF